MRTPGRPGRPRRSLPAAAVGTPNQSFGGDASGRFEYQGRSYRAMTELLRAIMEDHPSQPEEYFQTIFQNKFSLSHVQFRRAMQAVNRSKPTVPKGAIPIRPGKRKSSSGSESDEDQPLINRPTASATKMAKSIISAPSDPVLIADLVHPREVKMPENSTTSEAGEAGEASQATGASPTRTDSPEVQEDFSPPKFQIHVPKESNNNPNSSNISKEDGYDLNDESRKSKPEATKNNEEEGLEVVPVAKPVADVMVVGVEPEEVKECRQDEEEYDDDDDIMEVAQEEDPAGLNSSNSNSRDKIEAAMMEAVGDNATAVVQTLAATSDQLLQTVSGQVSAHQTAMDEAAAAAAAVTSAVTYTAATTDAVTPPSEHITDDSSCNQYLPQETSYPVESQQLQQSGDDQPLFNNVTAESHYPSSSYYEAALNAAVAKEQAVTEEQGMAGDSCEVRQECSSEPPQSTMRIPAKVEFFGRSGSRAQVGKMVFSTKGFFALSQDGSNIVYSLPRSGAEGCMKGSCELCHKNTHISCGGQ